VSDFKSTCHLKKEHVTALIMLKSLRKTSDWKHWYVSKEDMIVYKIFNRADILNSAHNSFSGDRSVTTKNGTGCCIGLKHLLWHLQITTGHKAFTYNTGDRSSVVISLTAQTRNKTVMATTMAVSMIPSDKVAALKPYMMLKQHLPSSSSLKL
jgi:hypothetical protein